MKKILFILAIVGLVVSSCGNKKKKDTVGTHTHSDGIAHRDDAHDHDAKLKQEAFEVKADSDSEHKHDIGEHTHEDGTVHADHDDHK